jgi:hypothetical protein
MAKEWRCFHCDEVFTNEDAARDYFGPSIHSNPSCMVDAAKLRELEARLQRYHDEDTDWHRAFYKLGSDHDRAMRAHGDAEYARGLRDGANLPADSPERACLNLRVAVAEAARGVASSSSGSDAPVTRNGGQ